MVLERILSLLTAGALMLGGSMDVALPDKDIDGNLFLINRTHSISRYFVPETRQVIAAGLHQSMRDEAATALEEMFADAKKAGKPLSVVSGYRSYSKQSTIYSRKVKNTGSEAKADELVARPGTSEHQIGLAMDIARKSGSSLNSSFGKTAEGKWVFENCWQYGFIIRYPEGAEAITGYSYEPWHVRYVGKEMAKEIYESGLPMESFMEDYKLQVYDFLIYQATNQ